MNNSNVAQSEHERVELLIPWYLNGSLNDIEATRVKQHVHDCELCKADTELVVAMLEVAVPAKVSLDNSDQRLKRVFNRIEAFEADKQHRPDLNSGWLQRLTDGFRAFMQPARFVPTAALAVVATMLVTQFVGTPENNVYEVRSSGIDTTHLELRVSLDTGLHQADIQRLVDGAGLRYDWASTSSEEIVIRLPQDIKANEMLDLINRLEAQHGVAAVETSLLEK